jgi:hypothetical protein
MTATHEELELGVKTDVPAATENEARRCDACDDCAKLRDNVGPGSPSWDNVPELETPEQLKLFPGLTPTNEMHVADTDGIQAYYEFSEDVPCSLKGRHPHRQGIVVKTLCNLVICMGKDCGKKSVIGFEKIQKAKSARVGYHQNLRLFSRWPADFKGRIHSMRPRLESRESLVITMREHLSALYRMLKERARQDARGEEVPMSHGAMRLRGLALFRRTIKYADLERHLSAFQQAERDEPPRDGPSADKLARKIKSGNDAASSADEWLRESAAFLTERNLNLALYALGRDSSSVSVEGRGFRVKYMPGESALLELPDVNPRLPASLVG